MKRFLSAILALLLLTGCSTETKTQAGADTLRILCTTYPVYLFATAVTEGVEGVDVSLLVNSQTSCLHDYTLTVNDMKAIEGANVIVLNGAGLEEFMEDALSHSSAAIIDCSEGIALLESKEETHSYNDHGHDEEHDPHIWMAPANAAVMVENIASNLGKLDEKNDAFYQTNAAQVKAQLETLGGEPASALAHRELITFHDGFQYFAKAFDLTLLKAIEEEEGATAGASEIREIVSLIQEYDIPAIYTEKNGSTASAHSIAAETGCAVHALDMIMSGDGRGIQPYLDAMSKNLHTIWEDFR